MQFDVLPRWDAVQWRPVPLGVGPLGRLALGGGPPRLWLGLAGPGAPRWAAALRAQRRAVRVEQGPEPRAMTPFSGRRLPGVVADAAEVGERARLLERALVSLAEVNDVHPQRAPRVDGFVVDASGTVALIDPSSLLVEGDPFEVERWLGALARLPGARLSPEAAVSRLTRDGVQAAHEWVVLVQQAYAVAVAQPRTLVGARVWTVRHGLVGSGGQGCVVRCGDGGQRAVVKVPHPGHEPALIAQRERLDAHRSTVSVREAVRATRESGTASPLTAIGRRAAVRILDAADGPAPFVVMEDAGVSLDSWRRRAPLHRRALAARGAVRAWVAARVQDPGFVHGDLKADNFLVRDGWLLAPRVVWCDPGPATARADEVPALFSLTRAVVGAPLGEVLPREGWPARLAGVVDGWLSAAERDRSTLRLDVGLTALAFVASWRRNAAAVALAAAGWAGPSVFAADPYPTLPVGDVRVGAREVSTALAEAVLGPVSLECTRKFEHSSGDFEMAAPDAGSARADHLPAVCVSVCDAARIANAWSVEDGLSPVYTLDGGGCPIGVDGEAGGWRLPRAEELGAAYRQVGAAACPNRLDDGAAAAFWASGRVPPFSFPCGDGTPGRAEVGATSFARGGFFHLDGNVAEWARLGDAWVVRGGSYYDGKNADIERGPVDPTSRRPDVGIRLVRSPRGWERWGWWEGE